MIVICILLQCFSITIQTIHSFFWSAEHSFNNFSSFPIGLWKYLTALQLRNLERQKENHRTRHLEIVSFWNVSSTKFTEMHFSCRNGPLCTWNGKLCEISYQTNFKTKHFVHNPNRTLYITSFAILQGTFKNTFFKLI